MTHLPFGLAVSRGGWKGQDWALSLLSSTSIVTNSPGASERALSSPSPSLIGLTDSPILNNFPVLHSVVEGAVPESSSSKRNVVVFPKPQGCITAASVQEIGLGLGCAASFWVDVHRMSDHHESLILQPQHLVLFQASLSYQSFFTPLWTSKTSKIQFPSHTEMRP